MNTNKSRPVGPPWSLQLGTLGGTGPLLEGPTEAQTVNFSFVNSSPLFLNAFCVQLQQQSSL